MRKWCIIYTVGNTYRAKYIYADSAEEAIKKSRIKSIIDIYLMEAD